ncbi:MAG: bifunctional folylpolyglutamate synthase/dihydrofolate synthase, partial [Muribaculaceae bacterium]|nr:bifunctional folylpolyglutamate synthase/dihydrofolate synthase [Muribaculaceae bacterium]
PGLDTSIALDNFFGNPHRQYRCIHIAGTNGKGSTSHMLAAILQESGYKVGLYTSPHLADFRERMRVNGEMIPREDVIDFVERWQKCEYEGHPSFFELTMMMAFDWFARQHVDIAVIEVGMGGRLDSTNIISPIGCVITNISPDHTQFLGDTLPKIASEKAGIIKEGIPVVIGEAEGDVRRVFEQKSQSVGAPVTFAEDERLLTRCEEDAESGGWKCHTSLFPEPFHAELGGSYQRKNINTLLSAVRMLRSQGLDIPDSAIMSGIGNVCELTGLAGRWMITAQSPLTICDTGHNEAGLGETMPQLERVRSRQGGVARLVIGFVSDKDVDHIKHLLPHDAIYYTTRASVPRAMDAEQLHNLLLSEGLNSVLCDGGVTAAYSQALKDADERDVIYIGGSTFVVADYLAGI